MLRKGPDSQQDESEQPFKKERLDEEPKPDPEKDLLEIIPQYTPLIGIAFYNGSNEQELEAEILRSLGVKLNK